MVSSIIYKGSPLYFLADDMGQVWLGGWRSEEVAQERFEQAEECNWDSDCMDCEVDVEMLDDNGVMIAEADVE